MKALAPALVALVLAACGGGGGGDAPQASQAAPAAQSAPSPAAVTAAPAPAAQPVAVSAPAAPSTPASTPPASAPAMSVASTTCTYPDQVGNPKPCDPRWPHPGVIPPTGSTQDQMDGYNAMCLTMICQQTLCPDGRVLPFYVAYNACPAKT